MVRNNSITFTWAQLLFIYLFFSHRHAWVADQGCQYRYIYSDSVFVFPPKYISRETGNWEISTLFPGKFPGNGKKYHKRHMELNKGALLPLFCFLSYSMRYTYYI
jgi:hypothetical protein